jgi:hypothetical protein
MFPASLGNIRPEREASVSELTRAQKEILANTSATVPVTGQYYDLIRAGQQVQTSAPAALTDAYVRGIRNKAGGVKSFAAAGYNYPSGQMVIGAALAGAGTFMSPSLARKQQMAQLLGLGYGFSDFMQDAQDLGKEAGNALAEAWNQLPVKEKLKAVATVVEQIGGDVAVFVVNGVKYKTGCVLRVLADRSDKIPQGCLDALNNNASGKPADVARSVVRCLPAAIGVVLQSGVKCAVDAPAPSTPATGSTGGGTAPVVTGRFPGFGTGGRGGGVTAQPPAPPAKEGLSTGAMVGIGAAVVAVLGIGGYFLLRKKAPAA